TAGVTLVGRLGRSCGAVPIPAVFGRCYLPRLTHQRHGAVRIHDQLGCRTAGYHTEFPRMFGEPTWRLPFGHGPFQLPHLLTEPVVVLTQLFQFVRTGDRLG